MEKKKNSKGKTAAVAAVTAASMLVGGAFGSPSELFDDGDMVSCMSGQSVDEDGYDQVEEDDCDRGKSRRALPGVRAFVLNMPVWLRASVCLPLWCLGTVLLWVLSTAVETVINPVLGEISGWLAMLLVVLLAFTAAVKATFPDLNLKKILNKKTLPLIVGIILLLALTDGIMPFLWSGYGKIENLVRLGGSLLGLGLPVGVFIRKEKKRRESLPADEESLEERMAQSRREVLELVDSIR